MTDDEFLSEHWMLVTPKVIYTDVTKEMVAIVGRDEVAKRLVDDHNREVDIRLAQKQETPNQ